jgi:hypothetical protein
MDENMAMIAITTKKPTIQKTTIRAVLLSLVGAEPGVTGV